MDTDIKKKIDTKLYKYIIQLNNDPILKQLKAQFQTLNKGNIKWIQK